MSVFLAHGFFFLFSIFFSIVGYVPSVVIAGLRGYRYRESVDQSIVSVG